ncbi:MAG: ABC transporter ATP-binding protein [Acidimicrobiales bacterium mtb01]|nr:ABC transporter ATP-binding protein [Actinomycetota bacterium]TEX45678.1 MAG: ABC transporter ATP-binding protein [Acidimicrobiales bacterium mtb01]
MHSGGASLAVDALSVRYGAAAAVRGVSLSVSPGEVVGLLGPNGAGKSSTLKGIMGIAPVASGEVRLGTVEISGATVAARVKAGLGLVREGRGVFGRLSVAENLRVCARDQSPMSIDAVLAMLPALEPLRSRRAMLLSGGEQQMLSLAKALVSGPSVLLIDELSLGLAPILTARLMATVRSMATELGLGVLLVEQHVNLALGILDRAYVLRRGELVAEPPIAELRADPASLRQYYLG